MNITFHTVDDKFNPESELYLEALGILASIPAAWLIATLVVLLIYLCTRCCDTKSTKRRKSRPIRCCLSFFALVTISALAIGFWGNHELHNRIKGFEKFTRGIDRNVRRAQELTRRYNQLMMKDIQENMNNLYDGPFNSGSKTGQRTQGVGNAQQAKFEIMENCDVVFYNVSSGLAAMDQLRDKIDPSPNDKPEVTFKEIPILAEAFERYRWPTTMALQGIFAIFCLLLFIGAIVHSRCILIMFSVFGLFSIIFLWLTASVYLTAAVALGDFCIKPTPFIIHKLEGNKAALERKYSSASRNLREGPPPFPWIAKEISTFYLECSPIANPGRQSPFQQQLSKAQRSIDDIDKRVLEISNKAHIYYSNRELSPYMDNLRESIDECVKKTEDLMKVLQCEEIYSNYNNALSALCETGLFGLTMMLISCIVSGLLFTVLVWCNSHTWIYFKHKGRYIKVDDADPYMPLSTIERPRQGIASTTLVGVSGPGAAMGAGPYGTHRRNMHTPPQTPPYHGTLNGTSGLHGAPGYGQTTLGGPVGAVPHSHSPYGHLGPTQRQMHHNHMAGTLGRNGHHSHINPPQYQGMDNLPATMTLGRAGRGQYAAVRNNAAVRGVTHDDHHSAVNTAALLGAGGQYATLSKQCKTLESSDFY